MSDRSLLTYVGVFLVARKFFGSLTSWRDENQNRIRTISGKGAKHVLNQGEGPRQKTTWLIN
jgi:hypothetical protein